MSLSVELDETTDPEDVGLLRATAVVAEADGMSNTVEKPRGAGLGGGERGRRRGRRGGCGRRPWPPRDGGDLGHAVTVGFTFEWFEGDGKVHAEV
jgi:hypothetical protein